MKATPEQIAEMVKRKSYIVVMLPASGSPYALSRKAITNMDRAYEYNVEVAPNGVELLVRRGKAIEPKVEL